MRVSFTAEQFAAFVVAGLIVLTAYGDAWLMFALAIVGLLVALIRYRHTLAS